MQVRVNGQVQGLAEAMTVSQLLERLGIKRDGMAVEINREIVPRSRYMERDVKDGDIVEIVTFVGGG